MANQLKVWNGASWVDQTPKAWNGTAWVTSSPRYFDGYEWRTAAPTPVEFPAYVAATSNTTSAQDLVSLTLPSDLRTNDYVVSVCAQQDGDERSPRLLSPVGVIPIIYTTAGGIRLHLAVWPWEPSQGTQVTWDVLGSDNTAVMNMVYRLGDVSSISITPVNAIAEYSAANSVPLPPSTNYTSVYIVLTVSNDLTGVAWPTGVLPRHSIFGSFGSKRISLVSADTPGAGASPGNLTLDTTVESAIVAVVQVPGRSDGLPTWILGDAVNSKLGQTTHLG
ncbi:hypothetical protein ACFQ71_02995 [Streptomyces sp. NPDC056534]|uniref:hypothetical protein n=1 Tax=Streptomyces sp. NPDC056534 TaxID=3345857 RepID=UPI0036BF5166